MVSEDLRFETFYSKRNNNRLNDGIRDQKSALSKLLFNVQYNFELRDKLKVKTIGFYYKKKSISCKLSFTNIGFIS